MGPFSKSKNCEYILVAVDYISKWVEAMPCRAADAKNSKKIFEEAIFLRFRVPRMVISDGRIHFTDKNFHYFSKHGIHHNVATPYRRSTRWGLHGRIDYLMHYGLTEQPIKHYLGCHHTNLSIRRPVIYLLS
jgi:hypothetical protein